MKNYNLPQLIGEPRNRRRHTLSYDNFGSILRDKLGDGKQHIHSDNSGK